MLAIQQLPIPYLTAPNSTFSTAAPTSKSKNEGLISVLTSTIMYAAGSLPGSGVRWSSGKEPANLINLNNFSLVSLFSTITERNQLIFSEYPLE